MKFKKKMKQATIIAICLYINGQIMMIFIFVYSKILLNSPFNDRPIKMSKIV